MELNNLKMTDLFVVCDKCNGSKNITVTSPRSAWTGPCDKCNGEGGQLTKTGKVLKDFIQQVNNRQI